MVDHIVWPIDRNMHFSIIIPTYNSSRYIEACLESIFKLSYPEDKYEIILVDGGSTDSTVSIAKIFSRVKILKSNNSSVANSRNMGAHEATGENLVFIDSDCLVDKKLLEKAYHYLSDYECCGGFYKPHPSHRWVSKTWLRLESKNTGIVDWITAGTLSIRKESFLAVGGFNEDFQAGEDVELGAKLRMRNFKIFNDSSIGSIHLGQSDNLIDFFKKEMWRGRSIIRAINRPNKKISWESAFNLMILLYFSLYIILVVAALSCNLVLGCIALVFLLIVPILLTAKKIAKIKTAPFILKACILNIVYLTARAASIIYYNQFRYFFRQ